MREFKKRRSERQEWVRVLAGVGGVLVLFVVTLYAAHAAWGMFGKFRAASRGQEDAQAELGNLQVQKDKLARSLTSISTLDGQEKELRERFGVARPGEGEIHIVHDAATTSNTPPPRPSWWSRVFHALFVW